MQASWSRQSRNPRAYASRRGSPQTGRVHTSTPLPGCPLSPLPAKLRGRRSTLCSPHLKYALIALGMRVEVVVFLATFPSFLFGPPYLIHLDVQSGRLQSLLGSLRALLLGVLPRGEVRSASSLPPRAPQSLSFGVSAPGSFLSGG